MRPGEMRRRDVIFWVALWCRGASVGPPGLMRRGVIITCVALLCRGASVGPPGLMRRGVLLSASRCRDAEEFITRKVYEIKRAPPGELRRGVVACAAML